MIPEGTRFLLPPEARLKAEVVGKLQHLGVGQRPRGPQELQAHLGVLPKAPKLRVRLPEPKGPSVLEAVHALSQVGPEELGEEGGELAP